MKKIYIILSILSIQTISFSQNFQWAKQFSGLNIERCNAHCINSSGDIYITGIFEGVTDFDPGPGTYTMSSAGEDDVFILKLDLNGNFLWAGSFGNTSDDASYSAVLDPNGNLIIGGSFTGAVDFDLGPGVSSFTSGTGADAFIAKYSPTGNLIFAVNFASNPTSAVYGINCDVSGNILATGMFNGPTDFDPGIGQYTLNTIGFGDAFICSLTGNGNFSWAYSYGSLGNDEGKSIAVDPNGNVYSTGTFSDNVDFEPGPGTSTLASFGSRDIYLNKFDQFGNFIFAVQMGSNGADDANSIYVDNAGDIMSIGTFTDTGDFDPGPSTYTLAGGGINTYISKLDNQGNFIWAKSLISSSGITGLDLATDNSGNVYSTGYFAGTGDFDPGPGTYTMIALGAEAFICKLNSNGNFVYANSTQGNSFSVGRAITVESNDNLHLSGAFSSNPDFDFGAGVFQMTAQASYDAFISKYCQTPTQPGAITGNTIACAGDTVLLSFPLVGGATSYSWNLPGGWTATQTLSAIKAVVASPGGTLSATANNNCGASPTQTYYVQVNPSPSLNVGSTSSVLCQGQNAIIQASGGNTYTWSTGANTASIQVSPTITTNYTINASSVFGCTASLVFTQTVVICTQEMELTLNDSGFIIYPNPSSGQIQIILPNDRESEIKVYSPDGKSVHQLTSFGNKSVLNLDLTDGVYFLEIKQENVLIRKKLFITK